MCGIAGVMVFSDGGQNVASRLGDQDSLQAAVCQMVDRLRHRGPDATGVRVVSRGGSSLAVLGNSRLSILDLSLAANQPMGSDDERRWTTFNGEIYNFQQLRRDLTQSDRPWNTTGDTEVVLRAYEQWGPQCVEHLRGMFAFAIFDRGSPGDSTLAGREDQDSLFLARDRFGIKPLYYFVEDDVIVFASEVRALLASGFVPRQLDRQALSEFLTYQAVPAPRTLIQGVRLLPPGRWLTVNRQGALSEHCYWDLHRATGADQHVHDEPAARRRVGELLREAVNLHLVSDVPVGIFLSGGIDSTAITALVREAGQIPRTFSVAFEEARFDESQYARLAAKRFQTNHTEIVVRDDEIREQVPEALAALDQPSGDAVNSYIISRAVRRTGIKVALSGVGGDELFAGYSTFTRLARTEPLLAGWGRIPAPARRAVVAVLSGPARWSARLSKLADILGSDGSLAEIYPTLREVLSATQRERLLSASTKDRFAVASDPYVTFLRDALGAPTSGQFLGDVSYAETRTYMHDVLLRDADQMSMAHGLELRVPLLDHVLAEYVVGLPDRFKQSWKTPKRLLVESLGDLMPAEIVHRPKRGFVLPMAEWMRGPLRDYCETHLGPGRLGGRGIFRPSALANAWDRFLGGDRSYSWSRIWLLVALEEWLATNLDRSVLA